MNEGVAALVDRHSVLELGFGTVSLADPNVRRMLCQVSAVSQLGLIGLNPQPAFFSLAIDDRRRYPVHAKVAELGLPIGLHTGVNYTTNRPMALEHSQRLDRVLCDIEGLKVVACHAGWPWGTETFAVMRRHPMLFVDFGGMAPKYVGEPNTGWGPMRRLMDTQLSKQVLFASDWPVYSPAAAVEQWVSMGLKPSTLDALMGGNARGAFAITKDLV